MHLVFLVFVCLFDKRSIYSILQLNCLLNINTVWRCWLRTWNLFCSWFRINDSKTTFSASSFVVCDTHYMYNVHCTATINCSSATFVPNFLLPLRFLVLEFCYKKMFPFFKLVWFHFVVHIRFRCRYVARSATVCLIYTHTYSLSSKQSNTHTHDCLFLH